LGAYWLVWAWKTIYISNGKVSPTDEAMNTRDLDKAALRGEPSYIWRAGQERRLNMILSAASVHLAGRVLENGCGIGTYLEHLTPHVGSIIGLEYDPQRAHQAYGRNPHVVIAAGEELPFENQAFDTILSHEVLEHVMDDRYCVEEMIRVLQPGGVILLFVPNRGYPFETHGFYWHKRYYFGNIPLINYLPSRWRNHLAPHVRVYSTGDLEGLFKQLPITILQKHIIFGAYDNIISRFPALGRLMRTLLQWMEKTPLKVFGLSHFWVIQKN
jgi:SAM-dependent methyltransferase